MTVVLTCVFDVEGEPEEKGVTDQLVEEKSKRVLNDTLHTQRGYPIIVVYDKDSLQNILTTYMHNMVRTYMCTPLQV